MLGCDIVAISRFERLFENRHFYEKVFHESELEYLKNPSSLAGFYAAKEAAAKALGCGIGKECSFKDIQILKNQKGCPILSYSIKIKNIFSIEQTALSISHDAGFAIAVVVLSYKKA